ncbi:MAG TPA: hypothetical protein VGO50_02870 [Pyrinomonadaceae bacterium]|jgi:hypothetical protein|nr:hypothetical protein [Pyrinomonadaceae bacterium]
MFDPNSRYAKSPVVSTEIDKDRTVNVVKLRRLPYTPGNLKDVKGTDRLDIMAHSKYKDGTKFWHIADSNTELEANDLVKIEPPENVLAKQEVRYILVPEN